MTTSPRVYVETTIPSFFHEARDSPDVVARRDWTRQWWGLAIDRYELVTSPAVLDELMSGPPERQDAWPDLLRDIPVLPIGPEIAEIVAVYIQHHLMPGDPNGDALHLALASYHRCDFLVTWNCHHLANANKFGHIRRVNTLLGLFVAALVTRWNCSGGSMGSGTNDPVIDEIREIRHRISARFGHDPARLVAHYIELQKKFADRFVKVPVTPGHPESPCRSDGNGDPRN